MMQHQAELIETKLALSAYTNEGLDTPWRAAASHEQVLVVDQRTLSRYQDWAAQREDFDRPMDVKFAISKQACGLDLALTSDFNNVNGIQRLDYALTAIGADQDSRKAIRVNKDGDVFYVSRLAKTHELRVVSNGDGKLTPVLNRK